MYGPTGRSGDRGQVSLETPPRLASNEILSLGEQHLAEISETQRPHFARAAPLRLVRARLAWWWLRRQSARVGIAVEHLRRAARSPRSVLGRRIAWLRVISWHHLLDFPVIAAVTSVLLFTIDIVWVKFGVKLIWSADTVFDVGKGSSGKDLLESMSTVLATVFGAGAAGSFALLWNDFFRSPFEAWRMRRGIRRRPISILPTVAAEGQAETLMRDDPLEGELIPRAELYDEVLPGLVRKTRRDVQIIVGDPGSGKTTALVALAGLLARVGMVPVFVALRGDKHDDMVATARDSFSKQVRTHMRATTPWEPLWRWLLDRKRIVVLIDDIDQIGTDGERGYVLRRTLDALAVKDFAVIVTARTAGIPAGVAASSIDLGALDEESVVKYTARAAKDVPGGEGRAISERALRRWVREGRLAEVPFYLELLACLNAAGKARELPSAEVLHDEGEDSGRFRQRADGSWTWNQNWVRFKLLELFYEWLREGSVRRWLAIERRERESALEQLENAALGRLLATARKARPGESPEKEPYSFQHFIDPRDRERDKFVDDERVRVSAHEVIDAGERLRILDRDQDLELQFRHRIMQAYMAARRLVRDPEDAGYLETRIDVLLDRHNPEKLTAHMTLIFAALRAQDRLSHLEGESGGGASVDAARFHELATKARAVAVAKLLDSARIALAPATPAPKARDPLQLGRVLDPENRRNPDDALINLTTAAEIVHALWRHDHARAPSPQGAALLAEAEVLQTSGGTTWIRFRGGTAAESSSEHGLDDAEKDIVEQVRLAAGATRWTKLNGIAAVAALNEEKRWKCIWEYARDKDYRVRRAAANELQKNAEDAYRYLAPQIDELLIRASARTALNLPIVTKALDSASRRNGDAPVNGHIESIECWTDIDVNDLVALGWVLPAIVSGLREDPARQRISDPQARREHDSLRVAKVHQARQALAALVALAFEGGHHNFESSVAQGFKDDAMRHAEDRAGRIAGPGWVASNQRLVAEICLDHAEFWYARMMLHQALALYAIAGANRRETYTIIARLLHPSKERHEFVRQAAKLAQRAVERKQVHSDLWTGLIWEDESQVVGRRANLLDDKTAQLVADVTLLLNLNEQSGEDRQVQFGHMHDLPHCLSASKARDEILGGGCPASCGWGLCPYEQPPPDEPNAQRGVSRAFCRQQQQIARRRRPAPWQRHIRRRALQRFWREMERRARS
jgi:hypothetical protein